MSALEHSIRTRLADHCSEVLAFGSQLRKVGDPGTADALRPRLAALLAEFERRAQAAGIEAGDVQLARYAMVAYLDEIVLGSHWDMRQEWMARPLQLEYFNEFTAGEEFYNKLSSLRGTTTPSKVDVLEVYALCLGLGFRGKYADLAGAEHLKVLMPDLANEINRVRQQESAELSPQWQPEEQLPDQVRNLPVWIVAAACGGVLLLLFLVFSFLLGGQIDGFLQATKGAEGG